MLITNIRERSYSWRIGGREEEKVGRTSFGRLFINVIKEIISMGKTGGVGNAH